MITRTICCYCTNLHLKLNRDSYFKRCGLNNTPIIQYPNDIQKKQGCIDGIVGCDQFKANGISATPSLLETLISRNPKCIDIPSDPGATENSYAFMDKVTKFLPPSNFIIE